MQNVTALYKNEVVIRVGPLAAAIAIFCAASFADSLSEAHIV
jgi:hypothetical protein